MKTPTGTWTRVRRGYWTWLDYEVTLRWVYEQYHERTHYWAWYVTVAGVDLPTKHASARQAKVAAEEHYARHGRVGGSASLEGSPSGFQAPSRTQPTLRELESAAAARRLAEVDVEKLAAAKRLNEIIMDILTLHEADFPPAIRPAVELPSVPELAALEREYLTHAAMGRSIFDRQGRRRVQVQARQRAQWEHHRLVMEARERGESIQRSLDAEWDRLLSNFPNTVMEVLARALDDNAAAAAPLGVSGHAASLVVQVPTLDMAPDEVPVIADTLISFRSLTPQERSTYYKLLVCGYVLVTIKEAFAVAPAIRSISIVAVRRARTDSYGRDECEAILTARFERSRLYGIRWTESTACDIIHDASSELFFIESGNALELQALDPHEYPDVAPALAVVALWDPVEDEAEERRVAPPGAREPIAYEPPSAVPPRWSEDPTGRHRLRYWDGSDWTVYVADGDEVQQDPI